MNYPCIEAVQKYKDKLIQTEIARERQKMIGENICPDCGSDLLHEEDPRVEGMFIIQRHKRCPTHGRMGAQ